MGDAADRRIAELEVELRERDTHDRDRQAKLVDAHQQLTRLRLDLIALEARARMSASSAATTASTLEAALWRLERYEPVIAAARVWQRDPSKINLIFALDAALDALDKKAGTT